MGPSALVLVVVGSMLLLVVVSPSAAKAARAVEPLADPPASHWKEQGPGRNDQGEGLVEEVGCVPTKEGTQLKSIP